MITPPDPNRIIIFSTPADKKPKGNSSFLNQISKLTESVEFKKLTGTDAASKISIKLKKANLTIKKDALTLLIELIAGNRGALETETDKIINFFEAGSEISLDDIRRITSAHEIYGIFDIASNLVNNNVSQVFKQLNQLISLGKQSTTLLFYMAQHFLLLYLLRNKKSLPGNLKWLAWKYRSQANEFTNDQLEAILIEMARSDAEFRRSNLNSKLAMETMVIRLIDITK
jgi:DNA polymerase III delta subunit